MLTFYLKPRKYFYIGWLSIISIIYISSLIGSRSYLIVGILLGVFSLSNSIRVDKKTFYIIIYICSIAYLIGLFSFLTESTLLQKKSVYEKFQFDSMFYMFEKIINDPRTANILLWEGNSRADILIDAFRNFTFEQYLWGRGVFGTYISFVKRSTIEMGWYQLFRWGVP